MTRKIQLLSLFIVLIASLGLSSCSKKQVITESQTNKRPPVINSAGIPTYVFYYAQWCGFCHKMAPSVKKASESFKDKIYFYYIDIDSTEGKEFSSKYRPNGRGIPYAQYYDAKGNFIKDRVGLIQYDELERSLKLIL